VSLALPSTLTLPQAGQELVRLQQGVQSHEGEIVIEAAGLVHLDSSAIAVLLQCRRDAQARGLTLRLQDPPSKLLELMKLYGVAELFA
jgi:phospholipid transport system transporter-binding protein